MPLGIPPGKLVAVLHIPGESPRNSAGSASTALAAATLDAEKHAMVNASAACIPRRYSPVRPALLFRPRLLLPHRFDRVATSAKFILSRTTSVDGVAVRSARRGQHSHAR